MEKAVQEVMQLDSLCSNPSMSYLVKGFRDSYGSHYLDMINIKCFADPVYNDN